MYVISTMTTAATAHNHTLLGQNKLQNVYVFLTD